MGGGGGLQHFSVSPRPLGFDFGTKGLGPGLDNNINVFRVGLILMVYENSSLIVINPMQ